MPATRRHSPLPRLLVAACAALGMAGATASSASAAPTDAAPCGSFAGQGASGRLIVHFRAQRTRAQWQRAAASLGERGAHLIPRLGDTVVDLQHGETVRSALCATRRNANVAWAEPDLKVSALSVSAPTDPYWSQLWGMQKISAPAAWQVTTGSPSVTVGITDTGMNFGVGDLAPNAWQNPGETGTDAQGRNKAANGVDDDADGLVDDVRGWDYANNDADPSDDFGHGSHVAGTIGARGDDGYGVAGVTWNSKLLPVKVLDANGSGYWSWIAAGFSYAASHGARVVSVSLGGQGTSQTLADVVNANPQTLFVFAAGNSAQNVDVTPFTPCNVHAANSICVAATDQSDALASFSNYGAATVDLAAPGVGIFSWWNGGLQNANGTSMATPHVSGAAALLFSKVPSATPVQVKQALLAGVDPVPALAGKVTTGGRLDVRKALDLLSPPVTAPQVTLAAASGIAGAAATLNGSVNPSGATTSYFFEWGTTTAYGSRSAVGAAGSGQGPVAVSAPLAGLASAQLYHYRLVATNQLGTTPSPDATFTSATAPATVTTGAAQSQGWSSETLAGTVLGQGAAGSGWFEYGSTTAYGQTAQAGAFTQVRSAQTLTATLSALVPGQTYHYRLAADNGAGARYGADQTFVVAPRGAPVLGVAASQATATSVRLALPLDDQGLPARLTVQYGETTAYADATQLAVDAAAGQTTAAVTLDGLKPSTTYHWRAVLRSAAGVVASGDDVVSTTATPGGTASLALDGSQAAPDGGSASTLSMPFAASAPIVVPVGITADGAGEAVLVAWVTGAASQLVAEYGADASYGAQTPPVTTGSGSAPQLVSFRLAALDPGQPVHARIDTAGGAALSGDVAGAAGSPAAAALPAAEIGSTVAELSGYATGFEATAALGFEWGVTTGYGHASGAVANEGSGVVDTRITGLSASTTYHYRLVVTTPAGRTVSGDQTFTTAASGAAATTSRALAVTAQSARLGGVVVPNGFAADTWFEYGLGTAYGQSTPLVRTGADTMPRALAATVSGLAASTTYHVRLAARVAGVTRYGADQTFTTLAAGPIASTYDAFDVAGRSATLGAFANAGGSAGSAWFEYGTDPNALPATSSVVQLAASASDAWVEVPVAGLAPQTTYFFRAVARSAASGGVTSRGAVVAFTTDPAGPSLRSLGAVSVSGISADLAGRVNTNGEDATLSVEWGDDTSYGSSTAAQLIGGAGWQPYALHLAGLAPSSVYHARVVVRNASGTVRSGDVTIVTDPPGPSIDAASATRVAAGFALVDATIHPNDADTTLVVSYGVDTGYGQQSAPVTVAAADDDEHATLLVAGLRPATDYHLRVDATSAAGAASSGDVEITTAAGAVVAVDGAADVAGSTAVVSANAAPDTAATQLGFEYGLTTAYGQRSADQAVADARFADYDATLTGLEPNATYHWRAVATSGAGTVASPDQTFTTAAAGPLVGTGAASQVTASAATIAGTVTPNREDTSAFVVYGRSASYDQQTAPQDVGADGLAHPVSLALSGLQPATTYHYALAARNASGQAVGADRTFTTAGRAPDVDLAAAPQVTRRAAAPNATVTAYNQATSCVWEYGPTASYGARSAAIDCGSLSGPAAVPAATLAPLAPGTTYHYRLDATNATGQAQSDDRTFTTQAVAAPAVTPGTVVEVATTSATIAALVDTGGLDTSAHVEYSTDASYSSSSASVALAGADVAGAQDPVSLSLAGLTPSTLYRYRVVVQNAAGSATQAGGSFQTAAIPAPFVTPRDATSVGAYGATLPFWLNANGLPTSVHVEYSTDTSYASRSADVDAGSTDGVQDRSIALTGLQAGATYHWRVVAQSASGTRTATGADFTTLPPPLPILGTPGAAALAPTTATVAVTVHPNGYATGWHLEYGASTSYGSATSGGALAADASTTTVADVIAGLSPSTTYHVRAVATSAIGTVTSPDATITTPPLPRPSLDASSAGAITTTSAQIAATINPNGYATTWNVEYGVTPSYGQTAAGGSVGSGSAARQVTTALTGLAPATTYHYRVSATSANGTSVGADQTLTTLTPPKPAIGATGASPVATTSAQVTATINPNGAATTWSIDYGATAGYGQTTSGATVGSGTADQPVARTLSGLAPGTTYHFRVTATSANGATASADQTFATLPAPAPTLSSVTLSPATTSFTVAGSVSSLLPGGGTVAWGVDTTYGRTSTIAFGAGDTPFQASATGLLPGATYHVRVTVQNANGTTTGQDQTVTTLPLAPAVAPVELVGVTTTTATLSAAVNPNGGATDAYVEYGPTTAYGQTSAHVAVPSQNAYAPQTFALTGLAPDTAYHARVTATNAAGARSAADLIFTTPPLPPTIASLAAQAITQDGFDVVATVDPHGRSGSWQLALGTSAGALQPKRSDVFGVGQPSVAVSVAHVGWPLQPATTYYVQLSVTTAGGTTTSDVRAVTTAPLPAPTLGAVTATPEITLAGLAARVRGNGLATSVSFQYGRDTGYGLVSAPVQVPADQVTSDYLAGTQIGGLAPATGYHFRVAATNSTGTTYSADQTFTTAPAQAPTISGLGTVQIDRHSATAQATVDARSAQTPATTYAEYGTDTSYGARVDAVGTQAGAVAFPLTGLRYGTTVHWRVVAQSAGGTTQSPDQTFTTLQPLAPAFAGYGAPTAVTTTSAVVSAGVAEYDVDGTVLVEYGPTTAYGLQTAAQTLLAVPEGQTAAVAVPLAGLQPGAAIHYRFVARNASGTTRSADQALRTLYPPDVVSVGSFTVAPDSASVPVAVDTHGSAGSAYVEYGADAVYGQGGVQEPLAAVDGPQQVTLPVVALAAATSYHFRVVATTANGSARTADGTFATPPWPVPLVASGGSSALDMTSALVSGSVTAVGLSASARFEYGPTTAYGLETTIQTLPARSAAQTIRAALAGLTPNTTYHWRVTAQNTTGTAAGADQTFTTLPLLAPVVTAPTVGAPSATAATVAAQVGSSRLATTVYLEYGTTGAYGTTTAVRSLGASTALVNQQFALSALAPATTYHLRVVARNAGGTTATPDRTFTTALLLAPSAETGGATRISAGSAVVSVRVANNNRATAWWVEYGTGNGYGLRTPAVALTVAGQRTLAVLLPNLLPVTEYHWRAVARSDGGTTVGDDASFETLAAPSDATDPVAAIRLPACGSRGASACAAFRATAAAWASLTGTATDSGRGASGVATVETNVYRALPGGVCQAFDGLDFQPMPCDRADDVWVPATYAAGAWRTALRKLAPATYTLRARATDWAGNTQGVFRSGANSLTVKLSG